MGVVKDIYDAIIRGLHCTSSNPCSSSTPGTAAASNNGYVTSLIAAATVNNNDILDAAVQADTIAAAPHDFMGIM